MKKIFLAITLIISIFLLGGCAMIDVYKAVSEMREASAAPAVTAQEDEKTSPEPPNKPDAPASPAPAKSEEPVRPSPSPSAQASRQPEPPPAPVEAAKGPFTIDETYFNILDATYADMAAAFGEEAIYSSLELGIYTVFDAPRVFCGFDIRDIERFYEGIYEWQMDDNEFDFVDGYADRQYIGETFTPEEFEVCYIEIYGDGVNAFFGYDEAVLLSEVNEQFGWDQDEEINFNEMYEYYISSTKEYGDYEIDFNLLPIGQDYFIGSVNIWKKFE